MLTDSGEQATEPTYSDEQVDQMYDAIERGEEPPGFDEQETPPDNESETPPPEAAQDDAAAFMQRQFEYSADGKQVKEPLEMILKRASMGYHAAQKLQGFEQKQAQFETLVQEKASELVGQKYGQIDEFARSNPGWMDYVNQQYELAKQNGELAKNPDDPIQQQIAGLNKTIDELKSQITQSQQTEKEKQEDAQLNQTISSVHEKYKDYVNPNETDQYGQSLEQQVLRHASDNGIQNYRAAFLDLFHDRLVGVERDKAKESLLKEQQKLKEKGFIGRTPTPTQTFQKAKNLKESSYNDLEAEAIAELKEMGFDD